MTGFRLDGLAPEVASELLGDMIRVRIFEERCAELYAETKIRGFLHLYIGEEAVAAGVMTALTPDDNVLCTYRDHGHALLRGVSAESIMAEMFGRSTGCSGGRGGSMHIFDADHRFYGGNAIVGGHLPLAVGLALADSMQQRSAVTACFFGEGAMAEGEFHESLNLAALWNLPVLFCCENNRYAMGTSLESSESQVDLALKAAAYAIPSWTVDGMDPLEVARASRRATEMILGGGGPVFIEFQTYRFRAHSMFDPDLYRSTDEIDRWKLRDPITNLAEWLVEHEMATPGEIDGMWEQARSETEQAVSAADAGPLEPVDGMFDHVLATVQTHATGVDGATTGGAR